MKKMKEEESITYIPIRYDLPTKIRMINGTTQARKRTKMKKIYKSLSLNRKKLTKLHFRRLISVGNRLKERIQKKLK